MATRDTQHVLLNAATELFYKKGYADTSIRDIGAKADMSTSLVYHYFKDKEEMLYHIVDTVSSEFLDGLREIDARIADPLEALREMLTLHMVRYGMKRKKETKIVTEETHYLRGRRRDVIRKRQREIYEIYLQKLVEMAETGRMNDIDPSVVGFSLLGAISSFHRWYREGGRLSKEEVAENILKLAFHGIVKSESLSIATGGVR